MQIERRNGRDEGAGPAAGEVDALVAGALRGLDVEALSARYFHQGELSVLPGLLPAPLVDALVGDVARLRASAVRRVLPGYKRSESIAWPVLRSGAPNVAALFGSPAFLGLVEGLADARVVPSPDWDPHACAVYHYDRAGDGIGYHYDSSWYRGARYTVLVGLVNRSSARLACTLHTREPQRPRRELEVATDPGTVVIFHGDKLWHRVTALAEGEERTVLTLQYVTDPRMGVVGRAVSFAKDAMAYFGVRQVAQAMLGRPARPLLGVGAGRAP